MHLFAATLRRPAGATNPACKEALLFGVVACL
jgi:hypothetical protein